MAKKKKRPSAVGYQEQVQGQGRPQGRPAAGTAQRMQQEQAYEQPRKKKKVRHFYDYSCSASFF